MLELPTTYAIQLQLLGGILISQTMPAVMLGLYTRWLHPLALIIGWAVGIGAGTLMVASLDFKTSTYVLDLFGTQVPCYAALSAMVLNIVVAVALSALFNVFSPNRTDATVAGDYV